MAAIKTAYFQFLLLSQFWVHLNRPQGVAVAWLPHPPNSPEIGSSNLGFSLPVWSLCVLPTLVWGFSGLCPFFFFALSEHRNNPHAHNASVNMIDRCLCRLLDELVLIDWILSEAHNGGAGSGQWRTCSMISRLVQDTEQYLLNSLTARPS